MRASARKQAGDSRRGPPGGLTRWVWAIAILQLAVLLATSTRYGYHRDELYFIVAGSHPAFGYPDQPPLVPLLCWAMNSLAPGSLLLLRAPSALAAAATTVLAALIARELGGGRRAQVDRGGLHGVLGLRARGQPSREHDDLRPAEHDASSGGWRSARSRRGERRVVSWSPVSSSASASRPSRRSGWSPR